MITFSAIKVFKDYYFDVLYNLSKNDNFQIVSKKGSKFKVFDIHCGKCGEFVLTYHKYGAGKGILRLYFHRIMAPAELKELLDKPCQRVSDVPNLSCSACEEVLGVPIVSKGQKGAFRMRQGFFHRKLIKKESRK